jgi:hypothetical protein
MTRSLNTTCLFMVRYPSEDRSLRLRNTFYKSVVNRSEGWVVELGDVCFC